MITPELTAAIEALIVRKLPTADWSDKPAIEKPRALRIYATDALFVYYLAPDGVAYELDLDRAPRYERIESADMVREVYAKAAAEFPELAALAASDPAEAPTTFEQALAYPAKVIAAWDDADPTGTTLIACTGNRPLASRKVTAAERDALLDQLDRDHPIGAVSFPLVWHVELITGFNVHDASGLRTSYVRPHDVARVRSSHSVELVDATGKVTTIVDDVDPGVASRMARDLANWLGRFHEDHGVPRANEGDLALVRACRELAQRNVEVPGYQVMRELRVSAGAFGGARDVAVSLGDGAVHVEVELASGTRQRRQLRKPADDPSHHFRTNEYLERPWIIRDIVRAVRELSAGLR